LNQANHVYVAERLTSVLSSLEGERRKQFTVGRFTWVAEKRLGQEKRQSTAALHNASA
jgi:hypothetical protein